MTDHDVSKVAPGLGTWEIDPEHAYVGFCGRRLDRSRVRGRFTTVSGAVHVAEHAKDSAVWAVVEMASVQTGSLARDDRLRSIEHFDVARHPTASFQSSSIGWSGHGATVSGQLTVVGVTNVVNFGVRYRGVVTDPHGIERSLFSATTVVNRADWGLTWNVTLADGGTLIGDWVRVDVEVETVRRRLL